MQKKLTHTSNASVNIRTDIICQLRFPAKKPDAESTPVLMSRITEFHLKISLGMLEYYHGKQK